MERIENTVSALVTTEILNTAIDAMLHNLGESGTIFEDIPGAAAGYSYQNMPAIDFYSLVEGVVESAPESHICFSRHSKTEVIEWLMSESNVKIISDMQSVVSNIVEEDLAVWWDNQFNYQTDSYVVSV